MNKVCISKEKIKTCGGASGASTQGGMTQKTVNLEATATPESVVDMVLLLETVDQHHLQELQEEWKETVNLEATATPESVVDLVLLLEQDLHRFGLLPLISMK